MKSVSSFSSITDHYKIFHYLFSENAAYNKMQFGINILTSQTLVFLKVQVTSPNCIP